VLQHQQPLSKKSAEESVRSSCSPERENVAIVVLVPRSESTKTTPCNLHHLGREVVLALLPATDLDVEELHIGEAARSEPAGGDDTVDGAHPGLGKLRLEQDVEVWALHDGYRWAGGHLIGGTWSHGVGGGLQRLEHERRRGAVDGD
jgi:hypothetical protein